MSQQIEGSIVSIGETQTFNRGFTKRELVISVPGGRYPQKIPLQVTGEKCVTLDDLSVDQWVVINFDVRGHEYNGRYFVNLEAWKIAVYPTRQHRVAETDPSVIPPTTPAPPTPPTPPAPTTARPAPAPAAVLELASDDLSDDEDIPF